jgi:hypothetical protein
MQVIENIFAYLFMRYLVLFISLLFAFQLKAQSNKDSLRKYVVRLSTLPEARNAKNIASLNQVAATIHQKFETYSNRVFFQKFELNKTQYKNVICSFGPDTASRIIIGGHYDVFGEAPGADNNASGIAGILELARLLKQAEKNLKFRIDLIAYSLEEPPFANTKNMGSAIHAKSLKENNIPIIGMINLKGIGFFTEKPRSQKYPFLLQRVLYPNRGNFISILHNYGNGKFGSILKNLCNQYANGLPVKHFKPAIPFPVLNEGDHKNYFDLGIPALLISNTLSFRNKYYHYDTDTFETLDYVRMSKVIDMLFQAIMHYY